MLATYTFEIKKSKFIGLAYQISTVDEFLLLFEQLKKEHKSARHITYAYKINNNNTIKVKSFDDGEPKGTASIPILNAIENSELVNIVIFVVRYFGKIKLGKGGLYRSYTKASLETIKLINRNLN